jgi:hypothetical protein
MQQLIPGELIFTVSLIPSEIEKCDGKIIPCIHDFHIHSSQRRFIFQLSAIEITSNEYWKYLNMQTKLHFIYIRPVILNLIPETLFHYSDFLNFGKEQEKKPRKSHKCTIL